MNKLINSVSSLIISFNPRGYSESSLNHLSFVLAPTLRTPADLASQHCSCC